MAQSPAFRTSPPISASPARKSRSTSTATKPSPRHQASDIENTLYDAMASGR